MLAIIGGTGFGNLAGLQDISSELYATPYGTSYIEMGWLNGQIVLFLPRHGHPPKFPPHKINYRANIAALHAAGVTEIVAITAVGTVNESLRVPQIVIPDQLIDYTWGRTQTFFDDSIHHVDLTYPYDRSLRDRLVETALALAAENPDVVVSPQGVYGCTQGPRLETAAEIKRLRQDGCDIVGMTAMPEAALVRERGMKYAGISVTINAGAGISDQAVDLSQTAAAAEVGMAVARDILLRFVGPA